MLLKHKIISFFAIALRKISSLYWGIIYHDIKTKYQLPLDFRFNGKNILFYGNGRIFIGKNSYIGENSSIQLTPNYMVTIGKECQISHNVRMYTQSLITDTDFSKSKFYKEGNIQIGDFCWIGANVFINPGVSIGNNCVVGANAVVTKNIPDNEIWGGVPAKYIKKKNFPT